MCCAILHKTNYFIKLVATSLNNALIWPAIIERLPCFLMMPSCRRAFEVEETSLVLVDFWDFGR